MNKLADLIAKKRKAQLQSSEVQEESVKKASKVQLGQSPGQAKVLLAIQIDKTFNPPC